MAAGKNAYETPRMPQREEGGKDAIRSKFLLTLKKRRVRMLKGTTIQKVIHLPPPSPLQQCRMDSRLSSASCWLARPERPCLVALRPSLASCVKFCSVHSAGVRAFKLHDELDALHPWSRSHQALSASACWKYPVASANPNLKTRLTSAG